MLSEESVKKFEREAENESAHFIVSSLRNLAGDNLTAYAAGFDKSHWSRFLGKLRCGCHNQHTAVAEKRLRCFYVVASLLSAAYGRAALKSWLFGKNSNLNDAAPIRLLRHTVNSDDLRLIIDAVKSFLTR